MTKEEKKARVRELLGSICGDAKTLYEGYFADESFMKDEVDKKWRDEAWIRAGQIRNLALDIGDAIVAKKFQSYHKDAGSL